MKILQATATATAAAATAEQPVPVSAKATEKVTVTKEFDFAGEIVKYENLPYFTKNLRIKLLHYACMFDSNQLN